MFLEIPRDFYFFNSKMFFKKFNHIPYKYFKELPYV